MNFFLSLPARERTQLCVYYAMKPCMIKIHVLGVPSRQRNVQESTFVRGICEIVVLPVESLSRRDLDFLRYTNFLFISIL